MRSRSSFTLIEVMICLALMAMLGGLLAVKSGTLFSKHRAAHDLAKFKSELRLTKQLSRSLQADIILVLTQTENGLQLERFSDEPALKKEKPILFATLELPEKKEFRLQYAGNGYLFPDDSIEIFFQKQRTPITP